MSDTPEVSGIDALLDRIIPLYCNQRRAKGADEGSIRRELHEIVVERQRESGEGVGAEHLDDAWPHPPDERAFHGLAGRFVELIAPHTEADRSALLTQFLAAFGNAAGRSSFVRVEDDKHFANLYVLVVGETARGRKGTSWRRVENLFARADPTWTKECILPGGLSSGEGVTWALRDADSERGDAGVSEKRLLVAEGEFTSVLKVLAREGNTLSPVLRSAWDTGSLSIKNKNSPCRATGAHLSVVAHVTRDEYLRRLDPSEVAGGTVNRILHVAARRSKLLPLGGRPPEYEMDMLGRELHLSLEFARSARELDFDDAARAFWCEVYPFLTAERTGLYGAATARAEAQMRRLSLNYALLDRSDSIRCEHLVAALALWDYCDRSAAHVFADQHGDRLGDNIMHELRARDEWMSRSDLVVALGNHSSGAKLTLRLRELEAAGLIDRRQEPTTGRTKELLRARKARKVSLLDLCSHISHFQGRMSAHSSDIETGEPNSETAPEASRREQSTALRNFPKSVELVDATSTRG